MPKRKTSTSLLLLILLAMAIALTACGDERILREHDHAVQRPARTDHRAVDGRIRKADRDQGEGPLRR